MDGLEEANRRQARPESQRVLGERVPGSPEEPRVPWGGLEILEQGSHSHHRTLVSCLPALGQGQGADCHELGQDAVSPEKPVQAAMGRG